MDNLSEKINGLCSIVKKYKRVVVAFSGGVDSTFLLAAAQKALGSEVVAVTVCSPLLPNYELRECEKIANDLGVEHVILPGPEMQDLDFLKNNYQRCYYCKRARFQALIDWAEYKNFLGVVEGTNADDNAEVRPGMRALAELQDKVHSPLRQAGFNKAEIRRVSRMWQLPNWDKPSAACLVSRLEYGFVITRQVLEQVEQAEDLMRHLIKGQFRVRHHGNLARIEVMEEAISLVADSMVRNKIIVGLQNIGYTYVVLDLVGYRSGSMDILTDEVDNGV